MIKKKIAIYSGDIPSTTFIENLIVSVADDNNIILLFGNVKKSFSYNNKFTYVHPHPGNKWKIIPFVLWNQLRLFVQSKSKFTKLSKHIKSKSLSTGQYYKTWAKFLPVIIHLPDVFHIQWAKSLNEWMFLKSEFGVKLILSLRGAHINYSPVADKKLAASYQINFPKVDKFHAVSKNIALRAQSYGANPERIEVIYTGLQSNIFTFNHKKLDNNVLNIISVGRFHWKKGYTFAIEAMNELMKKQIPFHYTIISSGDNNEEVRYRLLDLGLNNHVSICGGMKQEKVFEQIQKHDLLLLPSIEEGIANVVLESMALGTMVLSSDCGGMQEVLEDGKTGFIFQNREVRDMVQKIEQILYLTKSEKDQIVKDAKSYVTENHSLDLLGSKMKSLYEKTMISEV